MLDAAAEFVDQNDALDGIQLVTNLFDLSALNPGDAETVAQLESTIDSAAQNWVIATLDETFTPVRVPGADSDGAGEMLDLTAVNANVDPATATEEQVQEAVSGALGTASDRSGSNCR